MEEQEPAELLDSAAPGATRQGLERQEAQRQRPRRRARRIVFWVLVGACVAAAAGGTISARDASAVFAVSSTSMEDTLRPGDLLVTNPAAPVHRGDIIVVDESSPPQVGTYIRRVIGLPGDHVVCCDASGRITVNGKLLNETYVYPGDKPSRTTFDVTVPAGEYWLMGDHRSIAYDSTSLGPLRVKILGSAVTVIQHRNFLTVGTPETFVADGLAPATSGTTAPVVIALLVVFVAVNLLLLLCVYGTVSWAVRRWRRRRRKPATQG